jgi:DNA-binding transcriptional ArsR family regulator
MFRALSDPTRVEIVQLVSAAPRNVTELTSLVGVSQPKVSRHLKILRDAGLLNDVRRGKWVWYEVAAHSPGEPGAAAATAMNLFFQRARSEAPKDVTTEKRKSARERAPEDTRKDARKAAREKVRKRTPPPRSPKAQKDDLEDFLL